MSKQKRYNQSPEYQDLCWNYAHTYSRNYQTGEECVGISFEKLSEWHAKWFTKESPTHD